MPKLIRVRGDSALNAKEIRVTFPESIRIKPNSRIGVRSAHADILTEASQEEYTINSDVELSYKVGTGATQKFTVPANTYKSANELVSTMNLAMNATGDGTADYLGVHHQINVVNGFFNLTTYRSGLTSAEFPNSWEVLAGDVSTAAGPGVDAIITSDSIRGVGGASDEVILELVHTAPLVGSRFQCIMVDPSEEFQLDYVMPDDGTFNAGNDGNDIFLEDRNGAIFTGSVPPVAGDLFQVDKFANFCRVRYGANTTPFVPRDELIGVAPILDTFANWTLQIPVGSSAELTNCRATYLESLSSLYADLPVSASLTIGSDTANKVLGSMLGLIGPVKKYSGTPAILTGSVQVRGLPGFPGVLITMDGLELESYLGVQGNRGVFSNVIDVVSQDVTDLTKIRYEANEMLPLNIKTAAAQTIRDMTLRFERDGSDEPLEFTGTPVITLVIFEPDE